MKQIAKSKIIFQVDAEPTACDKSGGEVKAGRIPQISSTPIAEPAGSVHMLLETVGPLSAGNNFNWVNVVVVLPGQRMRFERPGCYGVYPVHGSGIVRYFDSGPDGDGRNAQELNKCKGFLLAAMIDQTTPAQEKFLAGYFTLEIENTEKDQPLVVYLLLAVDPGTTPKL